MITNLRIDKNIFQWILSVLLFLYGFDNYSFAQTASAKIDRQAILIGEQAKIQLSFTHPKDKSYSWPAIPDTINKIEIVERSKVSTSYSSDSLSLVRTQTLVVTCFDSGFFAIPPFRFTDPVNSDSLTNYIETQAMLLTVNTVPVDTSKAIKEIKAPLQVPFSWQDALPFLAATVIVALLIAGGIFLQRRLKKKPVVVERKIPVRPAHEIAIESLRKLEEEKLWQQGNNKEFHTRLTDIIRLFIEHRWRVAALEMTTDEILNYPVIYKLSSDAVSQLRYILELADFVKFAKMIPVAHENEQCLKYAYDFVLATRISIQLTEDKKEVVA